MDALLQQEFDGENTPSDSERLREAMISDAAVKARYDEYGLLGGAIASQPQFSPSADFTANVMAALPKPQAAGAPRLRFSISDFLLGPRLKLVYASVAGMLIATAAMFSLDQDVPISAASGSMVTEILEPLEAIEVGGTRVLALPETEALILEFEGAAELEFIYDSQAQTVTGVTWSGSAVTVVADAGRLMVTNTGVGEVRVELTKAFDSEIRVTDAQGEAAIITLPSAY